MFLMERVICWCNLETLKFWLHNCILVTNLSLKKNIREFIEFIGRIPISKVEYDFAG